MREFQESLTEQATEKGRRLRAKVSGAAGFGFGGQ
jgi:5-(carboxyamino)imidazole ribonucleotide mutase